MGLSPALPAWGILGGTFDPPHLGHLAIAQQTREALGLAEVLFIPAGVPPHKRDQVVTPPEHRVAMVELAIEDDPGFRLDRIEVDRPGPSYAVETMTQLAARAAAEGREAAWFILSAEALAALPTWRDPSGLLTQCRLAVVPRRGYPTPGRAWLEERFPGSEGRFCFLDGPDLGHSASDIRARVRAGRTIRYLVPSAVERYIGDHHLYRSDVPAIPTG